MKVLQSLSVIVCGTVLLAACSSTPVKEAPKPAPVPSAPAPVTPAPAAPSVTKVQPVVIAPYLDPKSPIYQNRSVYFDYDVFVIKPEFMKAIELQGKYLASNPKLSIRVEGNADERGSSEYNLALGQKRAEAVVRTLKLYGVKESQMEAISWGREKPKATGHDEASWSQNRRVDLVYPAK